MWLGRCWLMRDLSFFCNSSWFNGLYVYYECFLRMCVVEIFWCLSGNVFNLFFVEFIDCEKLKLYLLKMCMMFWCREIVVLLGSFYYCWCFMMSLCILFKNMGLLSGLMKFVVGFGLIKFLMWYIIKFGLWRILIVLFVVMCLWLLNW